MNVKFFKLNNGEEFMANILREDDDMIEVENPVVAIPDGTEGLIFQPWCPYAAERKLPIPKDSIMMIKNIQPQLEDAFKANFGSIIQPNTPQILHG